MEQFITVKEAAELTSMCESFWRKLIARRAIPATKLGKRAIRLREIDVTSWIATHQRPPAR